VSTPATTVVEAISAVMDEVQSVRKTDRNAAQNFSFRGIDATVNAVGPALRHHGVVVLPQGVREIAYEPMVTAKGAAMTGVRLVQVYRWYGPAGDFIDSEVPAEAFDYGDKGTAKAMSVAYRTMLLQALCIPTDEPDPDATSYERAVNPQEAQARVPQPMDKTKRTKTKGSGAAEHADFAQNDPDGINVLRDLGVAVRAAGMDAAGAKEYAEGLIGRELPEGAASLTLDEARTVTAALVKWATPEPAVANACDSVLVVEGPGVIVLPASPAAGIR